MVKNKIKINNKKGKLKIKPVLIVILAVTFSMVFSISGCNLMDHFARRDCYEEPGKYSEEQTAVAVEPGIKDISVDDVKKMIDEDKDVFILDVRTEDEYNENHLPGAINIPVNELGERTDEIPSEKPVIVYCLSGGRSRNASEMLIEKGFNDISDMGGISEWINRGYPVE